MEKQEKIFCGSAKIIKTQYGELTKLLLSESDLDILRKNLSKGWVNAVVKEKQNKVEGKPTHYLEIDNWKPEAKDSFQPIVNETDDMPF